MLRRKRLLLFILLLLLAAGGILWFLAVRPPAWFSPPDASSPLVAQAAEQAEYGVIEQSHRIRDESESWSLLLDEAQVNAWLAARLKAWAGHDRDLAWLQQLGDVQVRITTDGLSLAVQSARDESMVLVAVIVPAQTDGRLALRVDRLGVGRLTIPGTSIAWLLDRWLGDPGDDDDSRAAARQILLGSRPIDPVMTLEDGRIVRVTAIDTIDGSALLTCTTARPPVTDQPSMEKQDQVSPHSRPSPVNDNK